MKNNVYCLVCGYDFKQINEVVVYQTLCPCCLFHYGFDEVGWEKAFYRYRKDWLRQKWNIERFHEVNIYTKQELIDQIRNISKINLLDYYFGIEKEIVLDFKNIDLNEIENKWDSEFPIHTT